MQRIPLFELMDELYERVNSAPITDAPDILVRMASAESMGMEALARLLTIETARRRFEEAKYLNAEKELLAMREKA